MPEKPGSIRTAILHTSSRSRAGWRTRKLLSSLPPRADPQSKHIPDASKAAGFGPVKSGQSMSQIVPRVFTAGIGGTRQN